MKKEIEDDRIYLSDYPGLVALMIFYIFSLVLAFISCEDLVGKVFIALFGLMVGMPVLSVLASWIFEKIS